MEVGVFRTHKIGIIDLDTLRRLSSWLAARETNQVNGGDSCLRSRIDPPPPRQPNAVTIPLAELWQSGINQSTRQQVLQVLSRIASGQLDTSHQTSKPSLEEVSHE